jgi:two-component system, OmpR family, alkaline phosphatase synthesis response regulator PhoP
MGNRILVVEDNPDLAFGLRNNLEIEGYAVDVADDGYKALTRARTLRPDLIILDLTLPGLDGYRVLRTLRDEGNATPVLILSAHGEEADKVRGFRLGADDFVTKPFSLLELLARVQALLRRAPAKEEEPGRRPSYAFGEVAVDTTSQTVSRAGEPIALTPREYDLLLALLRRQGGVVSRVDLMRDVWGHHHEVTSRTVYTHIVELRRKLELDPTFPRHILTVRKAGYRIQS